MVSIMSLLKEGGLWISVVFHPALWRFKRLGIVSPRNITFLLLNPDVLLIFNDI